MKAYTIAFVFLAVASISFAAAPKKQGAAKKPAAKKPAAHLAASSAGGRSAPVRRVGARKSSARRPGTTAAPRQVSQQAPGADRYREIQGALAAKGYLKSEPNGVWDQQSMDAMRQFQTENNLPPTGKLSAASLISLGMGGSAPGAQLQAPAAP